MRNFTFSFPPQAGSKRRFHVMIKPVGASCNLACTYCYYLHKEELLGQASSSIMTDDVLEAFIRQYLEGNDHESIVFSWQGGEPSMLGIKFFEKVIAYQKKYCPAGKKAENTLQTNGTLLTDEWAAFLKQNNFLVGLSVDGPQELHDIHRKDKNGKPSFERVMEGYGHLRNHSVPFTALTTVNRHNAKKPLEVYRFLTQELGADYIQFNPCVEPVSFQKTAPNCWPQSFMPLVASPCSRPGNEGSVVTDWSVDPLDWGGFLCAVFDEWYENDLGRVLVNWFETAVAQTMNLPSQICLTGEICGKGIAIEHTGDVFSCDHYVYPEYCLGNIKDSSLADMVFSGRQQEFGFNKRNSLPQYCLTCPHGTLCWGQCPRHRFIKSPSGEPGLNYLCPGLKSFYAHAKPAIREIATQCLAAAQHPIA